MTEIESTMWSSGDRRVGDDTAHRRMNGEDSIGK